MAGNATAGMAKSRLLRRITRKVTSRRLFHPAAHFKWCCDCLKIDFIINPKAIVLVRRLFVNAPLFRL